MNGSEMKVLHDTNDNSVSLSGPCGRINSKFDPFAESIFPPAECLNGCLINNESLCQIGGPRLFKIPSFKYLHLHNINKFMANN